jgi:hypothetical protein
MVRGAKFQHLLHDFGGFLASVYGRGIFLSGTIDDKLVRIVDTQG